MENRANYANLSNLRYIEELYTKYLEDPSSVDSSWQHFFEGMSLGESLNKVGGSDESSADLRIFRLIEAYRVYGHKAASFNPIHTEVEKLKNVAELNLKNLGFSQDELSKPFPTCGFLKENSAPLSVIIDALEKTYCSSVGFEYMGMQTPEVEKYFQEKVEPFFQVPLSREEKMEVLHNLNRSEALESFIHMKYPGQKRFSLEGGETLIPMMMEMIHHGSTLGVEQLVIGMAHRGRLNVLTNILGKSYS
ncbi:MAG: 2-oxoglutarate dehydrogenase subunit E1, partial [Simkaniaceae bacterium]|nr:2-oxoglutarate dehydrogenase subunit E1 [Simkaniaceae bacterium]